jgi:hypothetical protein
MEHEFELVWYAHKASAAGMICLTVSRLDAQPRDLHFLFEVGISIL